MNSDDRYFLNHLRTDFVIQNPNAQYRPGRVSGEGSLTYHDTAVMKNLLAKEKVSGSLKALIGKYLNDQDGPDLAELEASYRV